MSFRPQSRKPVAAAAVAAVLLVLSFPLLLGGSTSYVVPRGASMEPRVSGGDLAVVRAQSAYRVGDIAAYRNTALHRVVVHRIVAIDRDVYTFKGDANDFVDPQQVTRSQIVGRLSVSLPLLGSVLLWLSSPLNALLLLALLALVVRDRGRLLASLRRTTGASPAIPTDVPATGFDVDDDRLIPIRDMSFPHELAVADVVRPDSLIKLADRYDRPVLYDEENGVLFVVESSMLFRCQLEAPVTAAAPLAVVRELAPEAPLEAAAPYQPQHERERRHDWPRRRDYGGRRKPSPHGRDWSYAAGK